MEIASPHNEVEHPKLEPVVLPVLQQRLNFMTVETPFLDRSDELMQVALRAFHIQERVW